MNECNNACDANKYVVNAEAAGGLPVWAIIAISIGGVCILTAIVASIGLVTWVIFKNPSIQMYSNAFNKLN